MTYGELSYRATKLYTKGKITLDKYMEMTKPLDREIEQEPKILETLDFAIDASNGDTNYFVGFRNGLRYAKSLIDGEEPQYESCAEQEPKMEQFVKWECDYTDEEIAKSFIEDVEAVKDLLPSAESEEKEHG